MPQNQCSCKLCKLRQGEGDASITAVNVFGNLFVPFCFPAQMKRVSAPPKSQARGVVFEEVITIDVKEDDQPSETKTKLAFHGKSK